MGLKSHYKTILTTIRTITDIQKRKTNLKFDQPFFAHQISNAFIISLSSLKCAITDTNHRMTTIMKLACLLLLAFIVGICQSKSESGKDSGKVWPAEKTRIKLRRLKDILSRRDVAADYFKEECRGRECADSSSHKKKDCCNSVCEYTRECIRERGETKPVEEIRNETN